MQCTRAMLDKRSIRDYAIIHSASCAYTGDELLLTLAMTPVEANRATCGKLATLPVLIAYIGQSSAPTPSHAPSLYAAEVSAWWYRRRR